MAFTDYLEKGRHEDADPTPALLFTNSTANNNFGDIFLFNNFGYANSNSLNVKSEITSHFTEANYSIQDHWALPPLQYTLSGYVGEVIYTPPKHWAGVVEKNVTNFLKPISVLSPTVSQYTQAALNVTEFVENTAIKYGNMARQIFATLGGTTQTRTISNQRFIFEQLLTLRNNRQLVNIYTPYGEFNNMAILSISLTQRESNYQSTVEVQLQQWRDVSVKQREATKTEKDKIVALQKSKVEDKGTVSGTNVERTSILYQAAGTTGLLRFLGGQ